MNLRPMRPDDLDDVVELLAATSASDIRHRLRNRLTATQPGDVSYAVVAELDGEVVGAGKITNEPAYPGTVSVAVAVDPAIQNRGVGAQLMDRLIARLAEIRDMKSATLALRDDDNGGRRFAERYGFEVTNHSIGLRLALDEPVETWAERAIEGARKAGVRTRVADLVADERTIMEVAGRSVAGLPIAFGEGQEFDSAAARALIPDRAVIILAETPTDPVAVCGLTVVAPQAGSDDWHVAFTGVDPDYRGRGVAAALKTASHVEAVRAGARAMTTDNDDTNEAILRVNSRIGMQRSVGYWGMVRPLG